MGITIGARAMQFDLIQKEAVVTLLITSGYQCFSTVTAEDLVKLSGWLQAEAQRLQRADPYHTLGLPRTASADEIKKAYRRLARRYHTDGQAGDEEKLKTVNAAYEILSDSVKRKQHNSTL